MTKLSPTGRILVGVGLLSIVGAIVSMIVGSDIARVVGAGLFGLAGIVFVALVFLLIGEGEDRERRRESGSRNGDRRT